MPRIFIKAFHILILAVFVFLTAKPSYADNNPALPPAISYSASIDNLPKWERLIDFYDMSNLKNPSIEYQEWWIFIRSLRDLSPAKQIEIVNQQINQYPYKQDNWLYKRQDYWASPSEFLKNGGDCEDFAIIKYMTLRRLGFRPDQMKIAMVYDIYSGTDHSYLVVDDGKKSFVLDSREETTDPTFFNKRFKPHYAFNEKGIWRYKNPKIVLKSRPGNGQEILPGNR